jgi:hypothetical protein
VAVLLLLLLACVVVATGGASDAAAPAGFTSFAIGGFTNAVPGCSNSCGNPRADEVEKASSSNTHHQEQVRGCSMWPLGSAGLTIEHKLRVNLSIGVLVDVISKYRWKKKLCSPQTLVIARLWTGTSAQRTSPA